MNLSSLRSRTHIRSLYSSVHIYSHFFSTIAGQSLYKRISPLGDPNISITPVLDQWIQQGNTVTKTELQNIIKELGVYKRFKHALEISHWMSDKMYMPLSSSDISVRLNLILRVHGLEHVEDYFNHTSKKLKGYQVYVSLLNCYVHEKDVEKAEGIFQVMNDMGMVKTPISYNILMNLYYHTGNYEKIDALIVEMEEKEIQPDHYSFGIRLAAYAAASDVERMDRIVQRMESDPGTLLSCNACSIAADGYFKVGQVDKAIAMLKKLERRITTTERNTALANRRNVAFEILLKSYAKAGKKNQVYRVWKLYKQMQKIYNKGYLSMIYSLLMLNDIEAAENIFEEWESKKLSYDFRIPNLLINAYCRDNLLEKAESLINRAILKGSEPSVDAWYSLAIGYLKDNQIPKAKEAIKEAITVSKPECKPSKQTLATCLKYLEGKGDIDEAEEFIELLKTEGICSPLTTDC